MDNNLPSRAIGARIRELRIARNMTQEELAGRDFTKSFISQIEWGRANPSIDNLYVLADRLKVPVTALLDEDSYRYYHDDILQTLQKLKGDIEAARKELAALQQQYNQLCLVILESLCLR